MRKLQEHGINVVYGSGVASVDSSGVTLEDGRHLACNVPVWATGAEAQKVSAESDLKLHNGYFEVNDFLQSTSHPNVFGGGDCITMQTYADKKFPPKAGVYAVRAGPFLARNVLHYIRDEPLEAYVPQTHFLSLLMLGNGKSIGTKFGITFVGKWVWEMKDFIDLSFMHLFDPHYLFEDYENLGLDQPSEKTTVFENHKKKN